MKGNFTPIFKWRSSTRVEILGGVIDKRKIDSCEKSRYNNDEQLSPLVGPPTPVSSPSIWKRISTNAFIKVLPLWRSRDKVQDRSCPLADARQSSLITSRSSWQVSNGQSLREPKASRYFDARLLTLDLPDGISRLLATVYWNLLIPTGGRRMYSLIPDQFATEFERIFWRWKLLWRHF